MDRDTSSLRALAEKDEQAWQPSLRVRILERLAERYRPIGDEPVDDRGIPWRVVHRITTVVFAVLGANILLLSFTGLGSSLANPRLRLIAVAVILLSPLWMVVGRRISPRHSNHVRHTAVLFGTFIFCFSAQYTGELRGALLATMLVSPILAATALPKLEAIPYVVFGAIAILIVCLYSHEFGSSLRAVVLMLVTLSAGAMVIATREQLVNALNANRDLSETDPLTGAANVRSMATRLDEECERASRVGVEFACAQFDLDEFKLVNDRHSHTTGDEVLAAAATAIKESFSKADLVARRGGDEFVVIIPAAANRDVDGLVKKCADAVASARRTITPDITPTASAGWVTHRRHETPEELLVRLDAELHQSKAVAQADAARAGRVREPARASRLDNIPRAVTRLHHESAESATQRQLQAFRDPTSAAMAIAWKLAAIIALAAALAVLALTAFGAPGVNGGYPVLAVSVGAILISPLCWSMSERRVHPPLLVHALAVLALSVITIGGIFAGNSSAAGSELYLLAVFILIFVLSARAALAYGAFVFAMYSYFVISSGYDEAAVRISMTTVVVLLISGVVALTRMGTVATTRKHLELAQLDALTGLPNLRQLRDRVEAEIRRCEVTRESFALVMLDLDNFKAVNDRHSHSLGDAVLIAVAESLREGARAAEMPARRGGDEFAVVLTGATREGAIAAVERIGREIVTARQQLCSDVTPTAGIGWVMWEPGESADELLRRVDDALHDAKQNAPRQRHLSSVQAMREAASSQ
ncbi:MAG: diguanylate cyclase [Solirubrobacterales bacterium]